ncbi:MAG TPA: M1 family aminopeptidase [Candidatus Angelobacter sp.]
MLGTIAGFELRQRFRRISTYVYFVVMLVLGFLFVLLSGGAFSSATMDFGTGGRVLTNSPYALFAIIVYVSTFALVITAALAGQSTYQDIDSNSTPFFYTAPITKFDYLAGRFIGSLAVQVVIFFAIGLGAWMGTHSPWVDPARIGPEHLFSYIGPYLYFVLPNLLITGAVFFAVSALTRTMLPVYISAVVFLIGYLVANLLAGDVTNSVTASLIDPFGANAIDYAERYWTPFQRNTQMVPFTNLVVMNRIAWLAVGIVVFLFTYSRFKMAHVVTSGKREQQQIPVEEAASQAQMAIVPVAHPAFSFRSSLALLFSLAWLQFSEVLKSIFFGVIAIAGYSLALIVCFNLTNPFTTPVYPVTYRMIELGGGAFGIFALAIITLYAGELVWRERDAGVNQIVDAMPTQRWVFFSSKLAALMLVQVVLELIVMAAGLTTQISLGYHHLELGLYFRELFVNRLLIYWVLCVFTLAVHAMVNNKYLGHFVVVLYYLAVFVLPGMGWENLLYRFGQLPSFQYSDMNGYGPFVSSLLWVHLYWGMAAIMLAVLTNLFWVRGTDIGWKQRRSLAWQRLSSPSGLAFSISLLLFIAVGGWIYYNTHVLNNYVTANQLAAQRAEYEKNYRKYSQVPQPKITDEILQVDLFPEERRMNLAGTLWLENKTSQNVDQIALTIWPQELQPIRRAKIEVDRLDFSTGQAPVLATPIVKDDRLGFYVFRLPAALPPHGRMALEFALKYAFRGFANNNEQIDLVRNGTFVNDLFTPVVGYQPSIDLEDQGVRHKYGLPPMKQIPKLEDVAARQELYDLPYADWINSETTLSTSLDQTAIAPGYLQNEWVQNGRRYFHYKMDSPMMPGVSINSARYQVLRDRWNNVSLEIYYDPQHTYDLERMRQSMKATLDYCTENFSPFQFHQLRIIEFPRYQTFAESFPNTIPFSESMGFITRVNPKSIDLPFFVTAHEIAHQWWGHQVMTANTEGATLPVESLAEYTALMVMKHQLLPAAIKTFLRRELDRYLFGRSQERTEERPLMRVTFNQAYIHYSKGAMVMYALQDYIGEDKVNQALAAYVKDFQFKGPPYPTALDLIDHLRKVTPPEFQYLYEDLFENITLYENRAKSATYTRLADGRYQVNLAVELKKFRADGRGEEHQIPAHDWVDIGVTDADDHYLYLQKHKIDGESADIQVIVDKEPHEAGIDPLNKLIDRKPDNNLVKVTKK